MRAMAQRTIVSTHPVDLALSLGPYTRFPCGNVSSRECWRATNTPEGPATMHAVVDASNATVAVEAWGPGRAWIEDHAPGIVGACDDPASFAPRDGVVRALARELAGLRLVSLGCLLDVAVTTVIDQRVTGGEARRSWRSLVRMAGSDAPGPMPLRVSPSPDALLALTDWQWRRIGIEGRRSASIRTIARDAHALDRAATLGSRVLAERLNRIRGVGPWTIATVLQAVCGAADAVPVGDWHFPRHVAYALAGEHLADDDRMLELLEPFRPHRGRALRLILAGAPGPPRHAPRAPIIGLLEQERQRAFTR